MEQLVARRAHNPKVVGSSPALATNEKPLSLADFLIYALNHLRQKSPFGQFLANADKNIL